MANTNLAGTGLEGHLRGLILNNAGGTSTDMPPSHEGSAQPLANTRDHRPSFIALDPAVAAQSSPSRVDVIGQDAQDAQMPRQSQTKATKKRPNQAQRRQMGSQFSIPIDTRQQYPSNSHRGESAHNGYYQRPHPLYHRHADAGAHQQSGVGHSPAESRISTRSWENHASNYPAHGPNHPAPFSNAQRGSSFTSQDRTQHSLPRHGQAPYAGQPYRQHHRPEIIARQAAFLDKLAYQVVADSEIDRSEIAQKEAFRQQIENISRAAITRHEVEQNDAQGFPPLSVELKCFGSLSSGFATKASDMDLGLLSPFSRIPPDAAGSSIPRLLEKALLDAGLGARLLTRTRVPIIKLCQSPPEQLRQGLLEEREKWENGTTHDFVEEDDHEEGTAQAHDEEAAEAPLAEVNTSASTEFELPCGANGEKKRFHLRQGSKSLQAYHALAKRVLRKAGGRDVSMSNFREFTEQDWAILDGVCQAFVNGLSDANLRQCLTQYPSLRFTEGYPPASHRSLMGVYTQIEGEHILRTWNAWHGREYIRTQSPLSDQVLRTWDETQRKPNFGNDPILYNKELQYALDKLKRLPFIQLITLEQGQHETPSQYHARAGAIIRTIQFQAQNAPHTASQALTDRYISGIYQKEVRDAVKTALESSSAQWDVEAVSRRHKSLHLAREFERTVEKGLYDDKYIADVKIYIDILRSPLQEVQGKDGKSHFLIAYPTNNTALISRIRTLQDPHTLGLNQARDKYHDRLEFPKTGAGIQCDINFSAHLALQNTLLLRCYSHSDPRVRPLVLFVKHWAKVRGINSGYRGTLSSYGYVLMVLHYLVNVVQPFVCPNLQKLAQPPPPDIAAVEVENTIRCKGYDIQFWRNEAQILQLARDNQLNHNSETIGHLLRGFFEYFAQPGIISNGSCKGFDWGRDVLSLRTHGGLVTKQEKGWTGAKTILEVQSSGVNPPDDTNIAQGVSAATPLDAAGADHRPKHAQAQNKQQGGVKEVRHRYLFAIEDPFELDHNVARTVTHNGIVSIRDEFRRAWAILQAAGREQPHDDLLKDVNDAEGGLNSFSQLLNELHGTGIPPDFEG